MFLLFSLFFCYAQPQSRTRDELYSTFRFSPAFPAHHPPLIYYLKAFLTAPPFMERRVAGRISKRVDNPLNSYVSIFYLLPSFFSPAPPLNLTQYRAQRDEPGGGGEKRTVLKLQGINPSGTFVRENFTVACSSTTCV